MQTGKARIPTTDEPGSQRILETCMENPEGRGYLQYLPLQKSKGEQIDRRSFKIKFKHLVMGVIAISPIPFYSYFFLRQTTTMEGIKDEAKKIRTKKRKQSELHTSTKNVWIPGNGVGFLLDTGIHSRNPFKYGCYAILGCLNMPTFKVKKDMVKQETRYCFSFTMEEADVVRVKLPKGSRKLLKKLEELDNTPANYAKLLSILFWNFQEQGMIIK